jgi:hypothetical protein
MINVYGPAEGSDKHTLVIYEDEPINKTGKAIALLGTVEQFKELITVLQEAFIDDAVDETENPLFVE